MRGIVGSICTALLLTLGVAPSAAYQKELHDQALTIVAKLGQTDRKSVAVVDFTDLQGNVTELGRFLAEELSVALSDRGQESKIAVVDRTRLKVILAEHKLSASGLMDPQAARRVAEIAGVDALVTGTVTPLGDSVRLTVKVLDVGTAKIAAASSTDIPKTQAIEALLGSVIAPTSQGTGGNPEPTARAEQTVEAGGIQVVLQGCRLSEGEVSCTILVTSPRRDNQVFLERLRALDTMGNEFSGIWPDNVRGVRMDLISGVPSRTSCGFRGIPAGTRQLAVLEFSAHASYDTKIQFRNVVLAR